MMVGKKALFILISILFQASVPPKVILFFGDSITAGYGLSTDEAFPAIIEKTMNEHQARIKAINSGLSGETSAGGLTRIDWVLRQKPDVFVLELGGNDGLRGLPLDQTTKNLQMIIDKVKTKYPQVKLVVAGMMIPPNMGTQYTQDFKNMYPALAKKNNATLIPFLLKDVGGIEKLNQPDGIHPNVEGHRIVAKNLIPILEKLLQ